MENLPFPSSSYRAFYKKNFIGNVQNFSIGYAISNKYEIRGGINFQHFTRRVKAKDTLLTVNIFLDNTINHRDYMYYASLHRIFERKMHLFSAGIGLYLLRPQQQTIEYGTGIPNFYINEEVNYENNNEEEGGTFIEFSYEHKFQSKVHIGVKTQFYFTISTGEAESIALFPFIKIKL